MVNETDIMFNVSIETSHAYEGLMRFIPLQVV